MTLSSCVLGWDIDQWPGPVAGVHGTSHGLARRPARPGPGDAPSGSVARRTAICVADFVEIGGDELVPVAPRTILRRQIEHLDDAGLTPRSPPSSSSRSTAGRTTTAARTGTRRLRPTTLARADYTIQAGDQLEPFFSHVRDALVASDLGPWTSQAEWGLGQWEINLRYHHALEMADRHVLFKLALRDLAAANGMAATFMAKPFGDTTGSSVPPPPVARERDGRNVFHDAAAPAARRRDRAATRDVGDAAPGGRRRTAARTRPHALVRADDQLLPADDGGEFSGNGLSWGWDSRMVSCRVLTESPESTRLEWRVPGADVNPYLAIAAVLASAADGIWTGADPGEPLVGEEYDRPVPPLPATLGEAVDRFRDSAFTEAVLGKDVVDHYAVAGRVGVGGFLAADVVTEWERRRYFEVI